MLKDSITYIDTTQANNKSVVKKYQTLNMLCTTQKPLIAKRN